MSAQRVQVPSRRHLAKQLKKLKSSKTTQDCTDGFVVNAAVELKSQGECDE
jgi:hypothetical protein